MNQGQGFDPNPQSAAEKFNSHSRSVQSLKGLEGKLVVSFPPIRDVPWVFFPENIVLRGESREVPRFSRAEGKVGGAAAAPVGRRARVVLLGLPWGGRARAAGARPGKRARRATAGTAPPPTPRPPAPATAPRRPPPLPQTIKVGTSSVIHEENGSLKLSAMAHIAETVRSLMSRGHRVVLVSSGAVGAGMLRLGLRAPRPAGIEAKQALASIGQPYLMRYWDEVLTANGVTCSQVLLTASNMATRSQYLNARSTFLQLLALGVVPIVNENDTVAVDELRYGDNDTLSAQVAALVHSEYLFLLTDVDGLYTANPSVDPGATLIREVGDIAELTADTGGGAGSGWGTGGMATKVTAARIATAAGCKVVISHALRPRDIEVVLAGGAAGTLFHARPAGALRGSKRWVLAIPPKGTLHIDAGAVRAVTRKGKSLFAAGITACEGTFDAQEAVRLVGPDGQEVARCLVNYSSADVAKVRGAPSKEMAGRLGFHGPEEVASRGRISRVGGGDGGEGGDSGGDSDDSDGAAVTTTPSA